MREEDDDEAVESLDAEDIVRARAVDELERGTVEVAPVVELRRVRAAVWREGEEEEVREREVAGMEEDRRPCSS